MFVPHRLCSCEKLCHVSGLIHSPLIFTPQWMLYCFSSDGVSCKAQGRSLRLLYGWTCSAAVPQAVDACPLPRISKCIYYAIIDTTLKRVTPVGPFLLYIQWSFYFCSAQMPVYGKQRKLLTVRFGFREKAIAHFVSDACQRGETLCCTHVNTEGQACF